MLPHSTRQQVFNALFDLVKTVAPPVGSQWKWTSQHLQHWDEIEQVNQPAMFLHRGPQTVTQDHAYGVNKWVWRATLWVYYRTDGLQTPSYYPDQLTDQFLDNIESVFSSDPLNGPQTLDGLVVNCWLDGHCYFDNGIVDNQAIIVCPISIAL